jgi:hypothetical protein
VKEVSGVPSSLLKEVVEAHSDVDLKTLAHRTGIDKKYLRRLVINPVVPVVKLGMADRILLGIDLSLNTLVEEGSLCIVPLRNTRSAAMRIVDDEIWVAEEFDLPVPDTNARIADLLYLYNKHCGLTDTMVERREADRLRKG